MYKIGFISYADKYTENIVIDHKNVISGILKGMSGPESLI